MQRSKIKVEIRRLSQGEDLSLPCYATTQSSGVDLYATLNDSAVLNPLEKLLVPTGIVIAIPYGFEGQIRPRSGLAAKHGITVLNSSGTIDYDYRGEVKICLINLSNLLLYWRRHRLRDYSRVNNSAPAGNQPYEIKRGDRIAQILISPVSQVIWDDKEEFCAEETGRNAGGFGSSGR